MRGVELDTVIHVSLQFWKEPWPFGMENEKSDIRLLHTMQTQRQEKAFLLFQKKYN